MFRLLGDWSLYTRRNMGVGGVGAGGNLPQIPLQRPPQVQRPVQVADAQHTSVETPPPVNRDRDQAQALFSDHVQVGAGQATSPGHGALTTGLERVKAGGLPDVAATGEAVKQLIAALDASAPQ